MTKRVALLISGSGSNMVSLAGSMTGDHPGRAGLVVSNRPDAAGLRRAEERGIPSVAIDHRRFGGDRSAFESALQQELSRHEIDVVCLAGFMRVLTAGFVQRWSGRMLNIHPSLLPRYRGLNTHARALAAGDREHGCTVHLVTPELDGGPILGQARVPILAGDTVENLAERVLVQEHRLYPTVLRSYLEEICKADCKD